MGELYQTLQGSPSCPSGSCPHPLVLPTSAPNYTLMLPTASYCLRYCTITSRVLALLPACLPVSL